MDMALDKIVPEDLSWLHTDEGPEFAYYFLMLTVHNSQVAIAFQRLVCFNLITKLETLNFCA